MDQYVKSGKVRFGYIHFAFLGAESFAAAEASECAAEQERFWEYHDLLFESQNGENQGAFSEENLIKFAGQVGLDVDQFTQCLKDGKYTELVQTESQFGRSIGVQSTPSFLVNGTPIVGAQPFESFKQVIEAELGK